MSNRYTFIMTCGFFFISAALIAMGAGRPSSDSSLIATPTSSGVRPSFSSRTTYVRMVPLPTFCGVPYWRCMPGVTLLAASTDTVESAGCSQAASVIAKIAWAIRAKRLVVIGVVSSFWWWSQTALTAVSCDAPTRSEGPLTHCLRCVCGDAYLAGWAPLVSSP